LGCIAISDNVLLHLAAKQKHPPLTVASDLNREFADGHAGVFAAAPSNYSRRGTDLFCRYLLGYSTRGVDALAFSGVRMPALFRDGRG
jgi:hypothetical protein